MRFSGASWAVALGLSLARAPCWAGSLRAPCAGGRAEMEIPGTQGLLCPIAICVAWPTLETKFGQGASSGLCACLSAHPSNARMSRQRLQLRIGA